MIVLILAVIFGMAIAYFATQNTTPVTIRFAEYTLEQVPLYLVALGSLMVGLCMASILYFAKSISTTVKTFGRDHALRRARRSAADLELRIQELEAENAELKTHRSFPHDTAA
jgi:uncharacterized integral membrane protein